jgi:hypothetical protein
MLNNILQIKKTLSKVHHKQLKVLNILFIKLTI